MPTVQIDPAQGFQDVVDVWKTITTDDFTTESQLYWHMGNTLDTCVTYLVQAQQKDTNNIVSRSCALFHTNVGTGEKPGWWRDDFGWWGIGFLNAADNYTTLGLDEALKNQCLDAATICWNIMNYDWVHNSFHGVRNNPQTNDPNNPPVTNTITNVLFMMLSLRIYETSEDDKIKTDALATAEDVFKWFYNAPAPPGQKSGLFTDIDLIRYLPGDSSARAWTGDQGWFLRAAQTLYNHESDGGLSSIIASVINKLMAGVLSCPYIFKDGVVHEFPDSNNWDFNFATGPGVFMRQLAVMNQQSGFKNDFDDLIGKNAQGAADNSGWNTDGPTGCWYPGGFPDCPYTPDKSKIWVLTLKTSAQDAFNAYMTVG